MYDVAIVGARCGGASLGMLLARAGHKVVMLDRMAMGTDVMSTHYIKRPGAHLLEKWGLLDRLRAEGTPEIKDIRFHVDGLDLETQPPPYKGMDRDFVPRRTCIDPILIDEAKQAGAHFHDEFTVHDIQCSGEQVTGLAGKTKDGKDKTIAAKIVVGADGINSLVAKQVKAQKHVDAGARSCAYYTYYKGLRKNDHSVDLYLETTPRRCYITFPTNDEHDILILFWPTEEASMVRKDLEASFADSLAHVPALKSRVAQAERVAPFRGTHILPNFIRTAHGPGWALMGDAAVHRDPLTAQGMTNAFLHADILAEELSAGLKGDKPLDAALADYDTRQFAAMKPMFDYTVHMAGLGPLHPEMLKMVPLLMEKQEAVTGFIGAFIGSVPFDTIFPPQLLKIFADDVAHGRDFVMQMAS